MEVLISGNNGFIGSHLKNTLKYKFSKNFKITDLNKDDFFDNETLDEKVKRSAVIVHLAGLNRHNDENVLLNTNINLAKSLIESIQRVGFKGKLIFASSIQESINNKYGKSKKIARELFTKSSLNNEFIFVGLIIPNVFGPFGKPNYNSFIPTFCDKIISDQSFKTISNSKVKLIYIENLIKELVEEIKTKNFNHKKKIEEDIKISVNDVKEKLIEFKSLYLEQNIIPNLNDKFDLNLFNTFRSYINYEQFFPRKYFNNTDDRGNFVEILKSKSKGQYSYSTTRPGVTRGDHFHMRKIERFSVIKGQSLIQLRKIGSEKIIEFKLSGEYPSFVDMPIWYTHNIKNIGKEDLITLFWINEAYDPNNPDTYIEKV